MKLLPISIDSILNRGQDISLLSLRLILAYSFYGPAMGKLDDISAVAVWFDSIGIALPTLNAYMATATELLGVLLLTIGLGVRYIAIALIVVLLVAIATVHGVNGFALLNEGLSWSNAYVNGEMVEGTIVGLNNGYEIVFYYILMLIVLVTHGGGRIGLDYFVDKKFKTV